MRIRTRLFTSHLTVVLAVLVSGWAAIWLLVPTFYARAVRAGLGPSGSARGRGPAPSAQTISVDPAFESALTTALVVAAAVGLVVAVVVSAVLARRVSRPVRAIQEGTHRLAHGRFDHQVAVPTDVELADLAASVNLLGATLQRTGATRARLISDLAHELRNPLTTISGYMEGLQDGVVPADAGTFALMEAETRRLVRLTEDLSFLARAQEGAIEYKTAPVDLAGVVSAVIERMRPNFEIAEVRLTARLDGPLRVVVDSDRIAQVITNVLANALRHTPPGGEVSVEARARDGDVVVVVTDTGEGIDPRHLPEIFERYTRFDERGQGVGIGLNIARTLARAHGGELEAFSEGQGRGASFVLRIPERRGDPVQSS